MTALQSVGGGDRTSRRAVRSCRGRSTSRTDARSPRSALSASKRRPRPMSSAWLISPLSSVRTTYCRSARSALRRSRKTCASLTIDDAELKRLRECRVEDCEVRLSADGIERVRREIDWHAADASRKASQLVRQLLVDYVARYRQSGAAAAMEYADRAPRLNVGREFASLIDADTIDVELRPAAASASARISSVFSREDDRLHLLVQGARARPAGHQHHARRDRRRRGRFTGGLRHWLEADLRDALLTTPRSG